MSTAQRPARSAVAAGERYQTVLASADLVLSGLADGVTVQDAQGQLLYVNDAAARICGFADAETMLAMPPGEIFQRFALLDEHGAPVDSEQLPGRRALAGESPKPMLLSVRHLATGRTWWTMVRAHAIADRGGLPELAVNIWYDATQEQKQRSAARTLADASSRLGSSIDYAETLTSVAASLVPELADWCGVDLVEDGVRRSLAVAHVIRPRSSSPPSFAPSIRRTRTPPQAWPGSSAPASPSSIGSCRPS